MKNPTLKQIAEKVGVSHQAVSYALNGRAGQVSEATRKRVLRAADEIGYRPNTAARTMRSRRTKQIGVLVPNSPGNRYSHPVAYETILGINEGLQKAGYIAMLTRIDDVQGDLADQSRVFKEQTLDGMIVLDSMPSNVEQRLEQLFPHTIWCDSNVWRDVGCLRRDERQAGQLAAQAVLDHGYRDALMMTYPQESSHHYSVKQRYAGARACLEAHGRTLKTVSEFPAHLERERAVFAASLKPDLAIICNSIYQASSLRSIAEDHDLIPGRDFGIVSCDDMRQLDRTWPNLARVSFDRYEMGIQAADMMLHRLQSPSSSNSNSPSRLIGSGLIPGRTLRQAHL